MRRISPGTVTIGVMAILFGLVAAYVIRQAMDKPVVQNLPPVELSDPGQRVVIATTNMVTNDVVTRNQVKVAYVPTEKDGKPNVLPEGIFRFSPPVIGRYLKQTVKAGQAITDDMLLPIGEGLPGLEESVPSGYRAMPLTVSQTYLRKLIRVGSKVDVTLTVEGEHPDLGEVMTETLLRNIQVIDFEELLIDPKRGRTSEKLNLTLAATPRDCNILITAEQRGTLGVTLVSPNEGNGEGDDRNQVRYTTDIVSLSDPPTEITKEPTLPPAPYTVDTWQRGKMVRTILPHRTIEEARRATAAGPVSTTDASVKDPVESPTSITTGIK